MEDLEQVYRTSFNSTNDSSPLVRPRIGLGARIERKSNKSQFQRNKERGSDEARKQLRFFREVACRAETEIIRTGPQTNV